MVTEYPKYPSVCGLGLVNVKYPLVCASELASAKAELAREGVLKRTSRNMRLGHNSFLADVLAKSD
jgi:hypothetical protein